MVCPRTAPFRSMSSRRRDLAPEKRHLPPGRYLPEIINEGSKSSALGDDGKSEKEQKRPSVASAASIKFQDFYHKYDWPSLSDTGTDSPECIEIGSSGSSASSMFSWADPNGTQLVAEEWEKIQRTLYDEEGTKVKQQHLIDECNQWKLTFPHLRVTGQSCKINNQNIDNRYDSEEEILLSQYENYDDNYMMSNSNMKINRKVSKPFKSKIPEKRIISKKFNQVNLIEKIDSYLHISPINSSKINNRIGTTSSIIRSEISSSRWRNDNIESPDFLSLQYQDKSEDFILKNHSRQNSSISSYLAALKSNLNERLSVKNNTRINGGSNKKIYDKKSYVLEPIEPILISKIVPVKQTANLPKSSVSNKHVSLPPLQHDESKVLKNQSMEHREMSAMSKYKRNKSLTPIDCITVSKIGNGIKIRDMIDESGKKITSSKKKKSVKSSKKSVHS